MSTIDWLSHFLQMVTVTGQLEVRCSYGAPWQVAWPAAAAHEIPYHIVLEGRVIIEDPASGTSHELEAGDIVLLPAGAAHVLHDGSRQPPRPARVRSHGAGWLLTENDGPGEHLDMMCGRFFIEPPHDRLLHAYLPANLLIRAGGQRQGQDPETARSHLQHLVGLMRTESSTGQLGGHAMLDTLTAALFTLVLRAASESEHAPAGLLAMAGHPRLAPAISAMFAEPARPWTLPELAGLCSMSRATFMRHCQAKLGRSAIELLTDIRMGLAANELKKPGKSTEAIAETVGYQSVAAFRRTFAARTGMTPGQWRRLSGSGLPPAPAMARAATT